MKKLTYAIIDQESGEVLSEGSSTRQAVVNGRTKLLWCGKHSQYVRMASTMFRGAFNTELRKLGKFEVVTR